MTNNRISYSKASPKQTLLSTWKNEGEVVRRGTHALNLKTGHVNLEEHKMIDDLFLSASACLVVASCWQIQGSHSDIWWCLSAGRLARKRRRAPYVDDEDIEERLESLIARVGEKVCFFRLCLLSFIVATHVSEHQVFGGELRRPCWRSGDGLAQVPEENC